MNQIWNEDCLYTMANRLSPASVDLTVTSPPYDEIYNYHGGGEQYDFEQVANALYDVTKPGGVVVWVVGDQTLDSNESGTSFMQALYFKEMGFNLLDTMIYQKNVRPFGSKFTYYQCFEYMFILSKGKPKTTNLICDRVNIEKSNPRFTNTVRQKDGHTIKMKGVTWKKNGKRGNVWHYDTGYQKTTTDRFAFEHPAMFPDKLAQDHIESWSNVGDLVYDPFLGSGTTTLAAKNMDRQFAGSEISAKYFAIAQRRMADFVDLGGKL